MSLPQTEFPGSIEAPSPCANRLSPANINVPLVVDLDGTLLKTDMLVESANQFVTRRPLQSLKLLAWLGKGRAYLKSRLAESSDIDVSVLPYNEQVVAWLKQQKSQGRVIVLATASHKIFAQRIAAHLGLFDEVLATDGQKNLKAGNKQRLLIEKYGTHGFEYVGNDWADLPIWGASAGAYLISPSPRLLKRARETTAVLHIIDAEKTGRFALVLKALRPHQWIKNLLIFIPLLGAHHYDSAQALGAALFAFVCFGLTASSVYLLNDLIDLEVDRHHARKKYRPFAGGNLNLMVGWILAPLLMLTAIWGAWSYLPASFTAVLGIYYVLTLAYSFGLKQVMVLDVLVLAGLYTVRLIAGAKAVTVPLSFWLLAFSMFIFLSLALVKRYSELESARSQGLDGPIGGRDYYPDDLAMISSMGAASGYLAVMVLALYIQDAGTANLYHSPKVIWLACPLLLYWISRVWLIAHRGQMHDDPIVFAIKDRLSLVVGVLLAGVFALARLI